MPPPAVSAQAWYQPTLIEVTASSKPPMVTGVERFTIGTRTMSPFSSPQHLTAPAAVTAHVVQWRLEIATTPLLRPTTSTGTLE